jgi:arabinose-5-phosphate isomerase
MGDALAVALLDARVFKQDDFARSHPGGALGRKLLTLVRDVMRSGPDVPSVALDASFSDLMREMSVKGLGASAVVDAQGQVLGIFTDGDLRRVLERTTEFGSLTVDEVMTRSPTSIGPDALAVEAVRRMEERRISQLPVVDADGRMVGALHIHDLLVARVV